MMKESIRNYLNSLKENEIIEVIDQDEFYSDVLTLSKNEFEQSSQLKQWLFENCSVVGKNEDKLVINLSDVVEKNVEVLKIFFEEKYSQEFANTRFWDDMQWVEKFTIDILDMFDQNLDNKYYDQLYQCLQKANNNNKENIGKTKTTRYGNGRTEKLTILQIDKDVALLYKDSGHNQEFVIANNFNSTTFEWGYGNYTYDFYMATRIYERKMKGTSEYDKRMASDFFFKKLFKELDICEIPLINQDNIDVVLDVMGDILNGRDDLINNNKDYLYIQLFNTFENSPQVIEHLLKLNPEVIGIFEENGLKLNRNIYNLAVKNGLDPNSDVAKECVDIIKFHEQHEFQF